MSCEGEFVVAEDFLKIDTRWNLSFFARTLHHTHTQRYGTDHMFSKKMHALGLILSTLEFFVPEINERPCFKIVRVTIFIQIYSLWTIFVVNIIKNNRIWLLAVHKNLYNCTCFVGFIRSIIKTDKPHVSNCNKWHLKSVFSFFSSQKSRFFFRIMLQLKWQAMRFLITSIIFVLKAIIWDDG